MLFNSLEFIFIFLPAAWLGYQLLLRVAPGQAIRYLGVASLAFYAWWDLRFVWVLLASIAFNFTIGAALGRAGGPLDSTWRRGLLLIGVGLNLGALAYFKYANFLLGALGHGALTEIVLPLGISFFTFTQIAFLVDTYRRNTAEYGFANYFLFVTYFPHLIAGPILHHKDMIPQFEAAAKRTGHTDSIALGLSIFAVGLAKKVFLADNLATIATPIFELSRQAVLSTLEAWIGALAYTLQLYFDFSGYCDMAIGLSLMFGIKLPINFDSPYKARSIIDFWRRWHITLSEFLRDYLYIPLGGNRHGVLRRYANLLATMLLGGLWHGAAWTFVAWGGLHGLYLTVNHAWQSTRLAQRLAGNAAWRLLALLLTFGCVVVAWVLFRAADFPSAWRMLTAMFGGGKGLVLPDVGLRLLGGQISGSAWSWGHVTGFNEAVLWLPPCLLIVWLLPNAQQFFGAARVAIASRRERDAASPAAPARLSWRPHWAMAAVLGLLCAAAVTSLHRVSEFLYYQF
jgi:alginate O-acetyltransferase complex protein AlgI